MAINYVAPQAPIQNVSHSYSGGGGGGGGVNPQMYAAQQNAQLDYMKLLQNAAGMGVTGKDVFQADAHIAAIQASHEADLNSWMAQRAWTARDQQELSRQQNAIGELISKRDSGEISEANFYQVASQVAPRINALQVREQHTKNQAMEEQRKAMAENNRSLVEQRDNALSFQRAETDGKLGYHVPPQYKLKLSEMMRDGHPELQSGTPEYDAMSTMMASEMGWAERFTKNAKGEMVFEKQVKGQGAGGASGASQTTSERAQPSLAKDALHAARSVFEKKGTDPSEEELTAEAQKQMNILSKLSGGQGGEAKVKAQQVHESAIGGLEQTVHELSGAPGAQKFVQQILDLTKKYPPGERPKSIQKRIDNMTAQFKMFQQAQAAQPAQPGAAPQPAAGETPPQWGQSLAKDVGNVGRGVGQVVRKDLQQAGEAIRTLPQGVAEAAPMPDSWRRYLFGE